MLGSVLEGIWDREGETGEMLALDITSDLINGSTNAGP